MSNDASPTRDLVIAIPAAHLTDPNDARRLAHGLGVLIRADVAHGRVSIAGFLGDVRDALTAYADELAQVHDQVVDEVMQVWGPTLDNGPLEEPEDPGGSR